MLVINSDISYTEKPIDLSSHIKYGFNCLLTKFTAFSENKFKLNKLCNWNAEARHVIQTLLWEYSILAIIVIQILKLRLERKKELTCQLKLTVIF